MTQKRVTAVLVATLFDDDTDRYTMQVSESGLIKAEFEEDTPEFSRLAEVLDAVQDETPTPTRKALELRSNGQEWMGTFANTVRYLVMDLLSDEEPIRDAMIETLNGGMVYGTLTETDGTRVQVNSSDQWIEFDDIKALTIA